VFFVEISNNNVVTNHSMEGVDFMIAAPVAIVVIVVPFPFADGTAICGGDGMKVEEGKKAEGLRNRTW
jgi:hypothetical protein